MSNLHLYVGRMYGICIKVTLNASRKFPLAWLVVCSTRDIKVVDSNPTMDKNFHVVISLPSFSSQLDRTHNYE